LIKFAFDVAHTGLHLALAPNTGGRYGQIIFIDDEYETRILVISSTEIRICDFVKYLENNKYYLAKDDTHYLTTVHDNDIIKWESSEKWNR